MRVPDGLVEKLRGALLTTVWPAGGQQRQAVESDEYLVLRREMKLMDPYGELKVACEAVMAWADPRFAYDHLAVTKNFIASPHVDKEDKSFQYAMAIGAYEGGGELCVESRDGRRRWLIDTREKLAKFDGRSVHWVRGYRGERFSVVWYINRAQQGAPQAFDVDLEWTPVGMPVGSAAAARAEATARVAAIGGAASPHRPAADAPPMCVIH